MQTAMAECSDSTFTNREGQSAFAMRSARVSMTVVWGVMG